VQTALNEQLESEAGVNLDEEAANMVKFQRAYQASARMMTALDEMLNTIINGMGLVGRS
jgi:flagellar hook-associated protein 1 FlgK